MICPPKNSVGDLSAASYVSGLLQREFGSFQSVLISHESQSGTKPDRGFDSTLSLRSLVDGPSQSSRSPWCFWLDSAHDLDASAAEKVIDSLNSCDVVVFSARSLGVLDGTEKTVLWPDEWAARFRQRGFQTVDWLRPGIHCDRNVPPSIAQNIVIFAKAAIIAQMPGWRSRVVPAPGRMLHPAAFGPRPGHGKLFPFPDAGFDAALPPFMIEHLQARWVSPSTLKRTASAVITFHNEGLLAHRTLMSVHLVREYAETRGLNVQMVAVLDAADEWTADVVSRHPTLRKSDVVLHTENADLGTSRNHGIQASSGDFIGTFDGDDLYSESWLFRAWERACAFSHPVVVHPDWLVEFDRASVWYQGVRDMSRPWTEPWSLSVSNPWLSCSFAARSVYECVPYARMDVRNTGFGFEDWHWNIQLLAAGIPHVSAAETCLFYRRKDQSMSKDMTWLGALTPPLAAFDTVWRQPIT